MSGWRDEILSLFTDDLPRLVLALDPDGLLREQRLADDVRRKGFDIVGFEDAVSFRYNYESNYRSKWDAGEGQDVRLLVRFDSDDQDDIPYDLLKDGKLLAVSIGGLFAELSCPVVSTLDLADLDSLFIAQQQHKPDRLGDNTTRDFILRYVFGIAEDLIMTPAHLLHVLLRRHYTGQRIPESVDEHLIQALRQNSGFDHWPLEEIVPHAEYFYAFLQERWPIFVGKMLGECSEADGKLHELDFIDPPDLPFDHQDVRVYMDNLFLEGYLQPIEVDDADAAERLSDRDSWAAIGIKSDSRDDMTPRLQEMLSGAKSAVPDEGSSYQDWMQFAHRWAQLCASFHKADERSKNEVADDFGALQELVDSGFTAWVLRRYVLLHDQPPVPPVMLHHIPRFLARQMENTPGGRVALVVVDGMAYEQWVTIRESVVGEGSELLFREGAVFAWVPTVTSVSRQAALSGMMPFCFQSTINSTHAEPKLWQQFWEEHGLNRTESGYIKGIGERADMAGLQELIGQPGMRAVAIVADKLDTIMHGMTLGAAGMHNQVGQWAQQRVLSDMMRMLLDNGYRVFLTSDHGNVESIGIGRPLEGAAADVRGERVRVYPSAELRWMTKQQFPDTIEWEPIRHGLPENYMPLLAGKRFGFVPEGNTVLCHGGISFEEVVVPFVEVKRRKR